MIMKQKDANKESYAKEEEKDKMPNNFNYQTY